MEQGRLVALCVGVNNYKGCALAPHAPSEVAARSHSAHTREAEPYMRRRAAATA